jgi:response regulator RpfG family c-di-GMP phosphodiesterase
MAKTEFILFIDDDEDVLEAVTVMIEEVYPHYCTAKSVDGAKRWLKEKKFDCIFVDINLNGQNGAEVIKYIRDEKPMKNNLTPLVIMSGYVNDDFREKFEGRIDGIIAKPFESQEILNTIEFATKEKNTKIKIKVELNDQEIDVDVFNPHVNGPFNVLELEENVQVIIKKMVGSRDLKAILDGIKGRSGNHLMKRIGLLINITSAIAKKLQWGSDKTLEKFVFASYLHDISLGNDSKLVQVKGKEDIEEGDFSDSEKELLYLHPLASSKIAVSLGTFIPSDVLSIIEQHHEKPDGEGFPKKLDSKHITPLACVFIVALDFSSYILEEKDWSISKFIESYSHKLKASGVQFKKILKAIEEMGL